MFLLIWHYTFFKNIFKQIEISPKGVSEKSGFSLIELPIELPIEFAY